MKDVTAQSTHFIASEAMSKVAVTGRIPSAMEPSRTVTASSITDADRPPNKEQPAVASSHSKKCPKILS